jgi:hypothetical protein
MLEVKEENKRTEEKTLFLSSMIILLVQIYSWLKSFFISAYSFSKETKGKTELLFNLKNRPNH